MNSTDLTLLPTRAVYEPGHTVEVEIRRSKPPVGTLTLWRLGERIAVVPVNEDRTVSLGTLPVGSYGVELDVDGTTARTAVQVLDDSRSRLRYGFVASYAPDKDAEAVRDMARRLHLNGIQFYDWAYRHADLLGGGEHYEDALGQPIVLATVRRLVDTLREGGTSSYGYAAVYAVGPEEWPAWRQHALLRPDGEPYALGDFLFIIDPAARPWLEHFTRDLVDATEAVGFDGFHLDQYGYPKFASTPDGTRVDVADSFVQMVETVREALPDSRLVFNNVNDFPTWDTASSPQDVVYIEPWQPVDTLGALAAVATRAKSVAGDRPVVLAAYQHVYDRAPAHIADLSAAFTMATLFSHGTTQLLAGEEGRLLVDPYYVRNREASSETIEMLARWYDFAVEHDSLLFDPRIAEVTASFVGEHNADLDVRYSAAEVSETAAPGAVWRRVTRTAEGLVVHLINLAGQSDALWDAPRSEPADPGAGELRFRYVRGRIPRVRVADPDGTPRLHDLDVRLDGDDAIVALPAINIWQVIHVAL
ncbi:glycoside hydrolase family 66 protein [Microbacterium karelineae]|uniref:glycoside hydrolase family 66 protein n=1 Tax=Microbacterium karelineae TaxID=2654283 RepID=UPI0012EA2DA2|nr:glycoside hydrolase family 66 protein [Microbacterium karelineae]